MPPFNDNFLRAARRQNVTRTPVWFMRQAGRYMPEYRKLREKYSLLEIARTPELALEVTLQPIKRFDLDAAILFADILLPLEPMGCPFHFAKGEGPVIEKPIASAADIAKLRTIDASESLGYVAQAIGLLRKVLNVPLIGFAGAPFTLASYMIEGGHSRHFAKAKSLMWNDEKAWHAFMQKLAQVALDYLSMQIQAGAQAIQLFDSWVGCLSVVDFEQYVLPHTRFIFEGLASRYPDTPRIFFGVGTGHLLPLIATLPIDVVGVDWQTPLSRAHEMVGSRFCLQGNLDPVALFVEKSQLREKTRMILQNLPPSASLIFNLGHGILPETPLDAVETVIQTVHDFAR